MIRGDFIFGAGADNDFSVLAPEFNNELNLQEISRQHYKRGAVEHNDYIIKYIRATYKKPNKQMQELLEKLQEVGENIND